MSRGLLAAALLATIAILTWVLLGREHAESKTAAIVDQLSLSTPNREFVAEAARLLEEAGYHVDYFPGEEVTVDFYRNLPTLHYDLIVFRVHVGLTRRVDSATGKVTWPEYVSIFTGEPFTTRFKYPRQGVGEGVPYGGGPPMYAITLGFVEHIMKGRFDDTLIVMMGCDGLRTEQTARAFLSKGARAYVAWSDAVSASHTDYATGRLLDRLLAQRLPLEEAVTETAAEVGPDPAYGGQLRVVSSQS